MQISYDKGKFCRIGNTTKTSDRQNHLGILREILGNDYCNNVLKAGVKIQDFLNFKDKLLADFGCKEVDMGNLLSPDLIIE